MRSSLDHLVYALATLEQGRPLTEDEARKTEFPIFGPEQLTDRLRTRKIGLLPERVQEAIARYQPHIADDYRRTKLWTLHALDNRNKHRSIDPQLVSYQTMMPAFPFTGDVTVVEPGSPLLDGLEILSGTPEDPQRHTRVVAAMSVVFPWHDPLTMGTVEGIGVARVLFDRHEHVRSIHEHLLGIAGHLVPFPGSNAPIEAQAEDEKRHKASFRADTADVGG